jgi:hypothetical protein
MFSFIMLHGLSRCDIYSFKNYVDKLQGNDANVKSTPAPAVEGLC